MHEMANGDEREPQLLPRTVSDLLGRTGRIETRLGDVELRLGSVDARMTTLDAKANELVADFEVTKRFSFGFYDPETGKQIPGVNQQIADTRSDIGAVKDIAMGADARAIRLEKLGLRILWSLGILVALSAANTFHLYGVGDAITRILTGR